ncbi:hypothetical protein LPH50_08905 [Xylella taiwanensis]|uniref:Uncharacterized protein n=2 Tax=Xylella taiwanensis TaxID=1444770 RepID=A0ABS8TTF2_9GAMM|nr:hypothetical protein [Xylella taiwanensis]MCD8456060.1 hypothetical protein [Xylella taiwanensis]MCD8458464.1 hypothetical protein [Xylella taiwanensis]MCD8460600.1 hypothetical protein [Xylella taiwanensis]MCD8463338.1 hypothetical protein [Xylella taiwanensis]MCD8465105.1 hypothetical protein [Xylella taiwanensis]
MHELSVQEIKNVGGGFFFVLFPESFSNATISSVTFGSIPSRTRPFESLSIPEPVVSGPISSGIGIFGTGTGFLRTSSRHVSIGTVNIYNIDQQITL